MQLDTNRLVDRSGFPELLIIDPKRTSETCPLVLAWRAFSIEDVIGDDGLVEGSVCKITTAEL